MTATADLCDEFGDRVRVFPPLYLDLGGRESFSGPVATVRVYEDNVLVARALDDDGAGRVLVVDGGGSVGVALLGDRLAGRAADHGWAGIVIHGAVRDTAVLARVPIGIRALAATPRRSHKRGAGEVGVPLHVAGLTVEVGDWLYADADGMVVAAERLDLGGGSDSASEGDGP